MISPGEMATAWQVLLLSLTPFVELRVGIPYGIARGLDPRIATAVGVLGTLLEMAASIALVMLLQMSRSRFRRLDSLFAYLDDQAAARSRRWLHLGAVGVVLAVALPLPGTGSWTGIAIAKLLGMSQQLTFALISAGIVLSGTIVGLLSSGVIRLLQNG